MTWLSITMPYGQFKAYVLDRFHNGGDQDIEFRPRPGSDGEWLVVAHFVDCEVVLSSVRNHQEPRVFKGLGTVYRTMLNMLPDADCWIGPAY